MASGHGVRHQNQRGGLGECHRQGPNDGLAGTARENHHARAAVPETVSRLDLVIARLPVSGIQRNRVTFAIDVPGYIFSWPTEFDECLLEVATLTGVNHHGGFIQSITQ